MLTSEKIEALAIDEVERRVHIQRSIHVAIDFQLYRGSNCEVTGASIEAKLQRRSTIVATVVAG